MQVGLAVIASSRIENREKSFLDQMKMLAHLRDFEWLRVHPESVVFEGVSVRENTNHQF